MSANLSASLFIACSVEITCPSAPLISTPSRLNALCKVALPSTASTKLTFSLARLLARLSLLTSESAAALRIPIRASCATPVRVLSLPSASPKSTLFLIIAPRPPTMALPAITAPKPATAPFRLLKPNAAFFARPCSPCMELPSRRMLFSPCTSALMRSMASMFNAMSTAPLV
jgi:hypothetical protein